jgi:hypothetical protein
MDQASTIIYGVVAGIITSFIIFLLIQIFNKIIIPWYKNTIYSGLNIEDIWLETHDVEMAEQISEFIIKQKAQVLEGLMTTVKKHKNSGETEIKTFKIKGSFYDGHVVLEAKNINKKYRGHVLYLLKITNGGASLSGVKSWVDAGCDVITSENIVMVRKKT